MDDDGRCKDNCKKDLRVMMVYFGFDFSLMGSLYLYEMLKELTDNMSPNEVVLPTITKLAKRHNVKMKTFSRDVRWAIKKAFDDGLLKYIPFFVHNNCTTKKLVSWLYNYYNVDL